MENRRNLTVRRSRNESASNGGEGLSGRKRLSDVGGEPSTSRRRTRDPSPEHRSEDEYDPDQSMQERRAIQRKMRDMQREMHENPDQFLQEDPTALLNYLKQSDHLIKNVKQTAEATIDSRGLVVAAELSARRVQRLTAGNVGNGIDADELVSKCITFMRNGGGIEDDDAAELSSTQRRRRRPNRGAIGSDDEEAVGDEGDMMNWSHLGRFASVPAVRRPCLPGFLLGPLSIEKKARRVTKRAAPFKISSIPEIRPEELRAEDLQKSDKNDLPSICKKIYVRLQTVQREAQDAVERELETVDEDSPDYRKTMQELMDKHALRETGGIDLLRFVINPRSFGQTVENMFYVSFLIREGSVKLAFDCHDLPAIEPVIKDPSAETSSRAKATTRHQAIMSIDMGTWRDIIEVWSIQDSIIPNREEDGGQGPGARGWYS